MSEVVWWGRMEGGWEVDRKGKGKGKAKGVGHVRDGLVVMGEG